MQHHHSHKALTDQQLAEVAGIGGAGICGKGRLTGEIGFDGHTVLLITAAKGTRSQVSFTLDLSERKARHLEGQRVTVSGLIHKVTQWTGTITHATIIVRPPQHHVPGEHLALSGKVANRELVGVGGEAAPSGSYLLLGEALKIGSLTTKELFLEGKALDQDKSYELYGRLELRSWGRVETGTHNYGALSGISDVGAGEPLFDGVQFLSSRSGAHLRSLIVRRRDLYDAPNAIVVPDPALSRAFLGSMGGYIRPEANPFHGFSEGTAIAEPTDADRAAIEFNKAGIPIVLATGHELLKVGEEQPPPGTADMFSYAWYFDDDTETVYTFVSGGIAGFVNRMSQVMRFGPTP